MKGLTRRLKVARGSVEYVHACLSVRKDLECRFHHCGSPVMFMQACVCAGKS